MIEQLHYTEFQWLQNIWALRTPWLDPFFHFWGFVDRRTFMMILIPLIWLFCSRIWGVRCFYLALLNVYFNSSLKWLFGWGRPMEFDPSAAMSITGPFGMPSGAAQTAVLLPGMLIHIVRKPWAYAAGFLFWFFLSFSRLYLGVHYITDLIGGWIVGGLLLQGYLALYPSVEKWWRSAGCTSNRIAALSIPLLFYLTAPGKPPRLAAIAAAAGTLLLTIPVRGRTFQDNSFKP